MWSLSAREADFVKEAVKSYINQMCHKSFDFLFSMGGEWCLRGTNSGHFRFRHGRRVCRRYAWVYFFQFLFLLDTLICPFLRPMCWIEWVLPYSLFFKVFVRHIDVSYFEATGALIWISCDISTGFQSQNGFCLIHFFLKFLADTFTCPILGPLVPLLCISSLLCHGFQSQSELSLNLWMWIIRNCR